MKRDRLFLGLNISAVLKWLVSFIISATLILLFILLLTLVQKKFRFDAHILKLILMTVISVCAGLCAFVFRRLSNIKGYVCGLITAAVFCLIKIIMSLASGGVGKVNFLIYICILCASLIGGITSANRRKKSKW